MRTLITCTTAPCALLTLMLAATHLHAANNTPPSIVEDEFHFIVLGDAQFDNPTTFNRTIDQVKRLHPAFVIQVGDLIEGYSSDVDMIAEEWQRFQRQIAPLADIPFYAIAGNHDVYGSNKAPDARLEALFEAQWGPLYFSFTYRNALVIGLNSDSRDAPERISDEQIQWMQRILSESDATHRFVFLHRPPMLMSNSTRLHEAFRQGGVDEVIYGHHHHYHHFERDGVRYTMTNASGQMAHEVKAVGGFEHLLHVSIRGADRSIAAIEIDAIHPQDMVAPRDNYDLFSLGRSLVDGVATLVPTTEPHRFSFNLDLNNSTRRSIATFISCASEDERWVLSPAQIPTVELQPGTQASVRIDASFSEDRTPESLPTCTVKVPFQTFRGEWLDFTETVTTRYAND